MKQEASAVLSRLEWYGMTFWTKLQHELLCFVYAEDEIFDSAGDHEKEHSGYRAWCDKCMYNLFSSTLIQVFPYSANISDMKWWYANNVVAERSSALDSSSGVARMWVRIPAWPVATLVSLSKTLNHNCFVLRMGRKAVGPVCCVMHVKELRTLIMKEKGLIAPVFLDLRLEHPAWWICARYKSYH